MEDDATVRGLRMVALAGELQAIDVALESYSRDTPQDVRDATLAQLGNVIARLNLQGGTVPTMLAEAMHRASFGLLPYMVSRREHIAVQACTMYATLCDELRGDTETLQLLLSFALPVELVRALQQHQLSEELALSAAHILSLVTLHSTAQQRFVANNGTRVLLDALKLHPLPAMLRECMAVFRNISSMTPRDTVDILGGVIPLLQAHRDADTLDACTDFCRVLGSGAMVERAAVMATEELEAVPLLLRIASEHRDSTNVRAAVCAALSSLCGFSLPAARVNRCGGWLTLMMLLRYGNVHVDRAPALEFHGLRRGREQRSQVLPVMLALVHEGYTETLIDEYNLHRGAVLGGVIERMLPEERAQEGLVDAREILRVVFDNEPRQPVVSDLI